MKPFDEVSLQLLVEKGLVVPEVVDSFRNSIEAGKSLVEELVAKGHVTEGEIANLLAEEFSLSLQDPNELTIDRVDRSLIDKAFALDWGVLLFDSSSSVTKAIICDPLNLDQLDNLSASLERDIEVFLCGPSALKEAIQRYYPLERDSLQPIFSEYSEAEPQVGDPRLDISASNRDEGAIVHYVHLIIKEALKQGASDIHLEPLEKRFRIRFRVDGVLQKIENPPKRLQPAIISRIKLMSQMSIAEKRLPQDGRVRIDLDGRSVDFRVSAIPSAHGESVVMRILDKEKLELGLQELGFYDDDKKLVEELIAQPDGIILVTGPTGSGKSTTLYSFLSQLNKPDRKIITVEDPVEYQLSGINQVQVQNETGMTFSSGLRAMLRQAPNIIMVGEIRDLETVEIAINAALTGHLVFSTLHTNDAPSAVSRLRDLGVAPFLISSSVRAIMAQRLIRRVCPDCSEPVSPSAVDIAAVGCHADEADSAQWREGRGCSSCRGTGYRGRIGIFETMKITSDMESLIYSNGSLADIRKLARSQGMRTMREDGLRKAMRGQTTINEVLAVTNN